MKQDFKISKRFLWFNRIAFLAIYVFFVFLSFMFRGSDNHVYDIVYLFEFLLYICRPYETSDSGERVALQAL